MQRRTRSILGVLVLSSCTPAYVEPDREWSDDAAIPEDASTSSFDAGVEDADSMDSGAGNADASVEEPDASSSEPPPPGLTTAWVVNPTSGSNLYVEIYRPETGADGDAVIMLPGGTSDHSVFLAGANAALGLLDTGYIVVLFDPEGRGMSEGTDRTNGNIGQDGLAAIAQYVLDQPDIDRFGIFSVSAGVVLGSGTLARHPEIGASFFIDWEGPSGESSDDIGRGCAADGVCQGDAPPACCQWSSIFYIDEVPVPYLRLQSETDHHQPNVLNAIHLINEAVSGSVPWVRLNNGPEIDVMYEDENPPEMLSDEFDFPMVQNALPFIDEMFELADSR